MTPTESAATKVKTAREAKGWSQQKLASEAGLSYRTVWSLESGKAVSLRTLQLIAPRLGLEVGDLVAGLAAPAEVPA